MDLTFQRMDEIVIIRIIGNNLLFSNETTYFKEFYPLDYLKLDYEGIIKEFPDLKEMGVDDAREEAIERLKEHIRKIGNEDGIKNYVINEFEFWGWILKIIKRDGFRELRIN